MSWKVEMFHDGDCALCMREVRMLRRLDRGRGNIRFTDISRPQFDASAYGLTRSQFMARIKARTPDGRWLDGVDVFAELYAAVGVGVVRRLADSAVLRPALDHAYDVFARNRLRLTGRADECDTSCTLGADSA